MSTYATVKKRAGALAETASGQSIEEVRKVGVRDIDDLLLSDRDHPRPMRFLLLLTQAFSVGERKTLLNGFARAYAGASGWLAYIGHDVRKYNQKMHSSLPS